MGFNDEGRTQQVSQKKSVGENLFTRIAKADNATLNRAQAVLVSNGFPRAKNRLEVALMLAKAYKERGEVLIPALIEIHPDKSFFDEYYQNIIDEKLAKQKSEFEQEKKEAKYSNDCGCGGSKGRYSNDNGGFGATAPVQSSITEHLPYVALTCVVGLLGISMIAIAKSNKI